MLMFGRIICEVKQTYVNQIKFYSVTFFIWTKLKTKTSFPHIHIYSEDSWSAVLN